MKNTYLFKTKRIMAIGERFVIASKIHRQVFMVAGVGVTPGIYWIIPVEVV